MTPGLLAAALAVGLDAGAPAPAGSDAVPRVVVLISANMEWKFVRPEAHGGGVSRSPFGDFFTREVRAGARTRPVVFLHGGWGKISAAASAQYAIDRWRPELLVNLGTCGGFRGAIEKGAVILVDRTIVYDIVEQMGDSAEAIAEYSTDIDVSWAGSSLPQGTRKGLLLSGDRDVVPSEIAALRARYEAVAADWESGAIAYVARANRTPLLILRGVSDLVGVEGGEAYGNEQAFEDGARRVMARLLEDLPSWLGRWEAGRPPPPGPSPRP